ncbi:MAG: hypothetical protein AAFV31_06605 [Pseudomonadota bacterium]
MSAPVVDEVFGTAEQQTLLRRGWAILTVIDPDAVAGGQLTK